MGYLEFADLKIGDRLTILRRPPSWSYYIDNEINVPKYPYTFTVAFMEHIHDEVYAYFGLIKVIDEFENEWLIEKETYRCYEKNILNNRRNRIDNLNIE